MDTGQDQKPAKLNKNHQKILELSQKDVSTVDIAKVVNIHPNSVSRVKADLSKYSISSDKKLLKKCSKALHKIIDGFMLGDKRIRRIKTLTYK
jgi:hypothetical protein